LSGFSEKFLHRRGKEKDGKHGFKKDSTFARQEYFYDLREDSLNQGVPKRQSEILPIRNPS
jgi:hypothetical protein